MADHGENYKRIKAEDGSEIGSLGPACGHHCGVITVGHDDRHSGHCACPECHNTPMPAIIKIGNTGRVPRVQ